MKKKYPNWEGRGKLSLFADEMILYIENPKVFTPKLLELINSSRLQGASINYELGIIIPILDAEIKALRLSK